jgi:hypothetical protein
VKTATDVRQTLRAIAASDAKVAFDGCHKLYLIFDDEDMEIATANGYLAEDIFPATEIHRLWESSCGLRFVHPINLDMKHPWNIEQGVLG